MKTTMITKLASLLATLTLGAFGSGCLIVDGGSSTYVDPGPSEPLIADITIDTAASMLANPGDGVGVFVEYAGAGHWDVYTTCDTSISGTSCNFDLLISADARVQLFNVEGVDLNPYDALTLNSDGSIQLVSDTDFGMNGVSFDADPGATIELDVLVDGISRPEYVFVVSEGALLEGVPTNPVDFTPASF